MACYVDEVRDHNGVDNPATRKYGHAWSHLVADSREELDALARAIGLRPAYRQHSGLPLEHYDLTPRKRELAIAKGAVPLTFEEFRRLLAGKVEAFHAMREEE